MNAEPLSCAVCGAVLDPATAYPTIRRADGQGAGWVCREVDPCLSRRAAQGQPERKEARR